MIPNCKKDLGGGSSSYEEISETFNSTSGSREIVEQQYARKYNDGTLVIQCKLTAWLTIINQYTAGYRSMTIAFNDFIVPFTASHVDTFKRPQVFWNIYNYDSGNDSSEMWLIQYIPQFRPTETNPGRVCLARNVRMSTEYQAAIGYTALGRWK